MEKVNEEFIDDTVQEGSVEDLPEEDIEVQE